jgi:hypothetical protein
MIAACTPNDDNPCDEQQRAEEGNCFKYKGWMRNGCMQFVAICADGINLTRPLRGVMPT